MKPAWICSDLDLRHTDLLSKRDHLHIDTYICDVGCSLVSGRMTDIYQQIDQLICAKQ